MTPYFATALGVGCALWEVSDEHVYGFAEASEQESGPEIPPEVHNTRPINAETCMAAVRAMCGGVR